MRAGLAVWTVVALGLAPASTAVSSEEGVKTGTGAPPQVEFVSFIDPVGDATGRAPDISDVIVSRDDAGLIEVQTSMVGFTPVSTVTLYLDTDASSATGAPGGFEYAVSALTVPGRKQFRFRAWSGGQWVDAAAPTLGARISWGGRDARFLVAINASDLGHTPAFAVRLETAGHDADGAAVGADRAPDEGVGAWQFDAVPPPLPIPPPTPVIGTPLTTPARAVAGKRFTAAFSVTWSDSGRPLTGGALVFDAAVAGKLLPHTESFTAGRARLSLLVPKTAKGKLLTIKVAIQADDRSATKVVAFRIR